MPKEKINRWYNSLLISDLMPDHVPLDVNKIITSFAFISKGKNGIVCPWRVSIQLCYAQLYAA